MAARVGIVVYESFVLGQAATLVDVLQFAAGLDSRAYGLKLYECTLLSADGGAVSAAGDISVNTTAFADAGRFDHVVVCGGVSVSAAIASTRIGAFVLDQARTARTVNAIASGTLLLASTGLLDGRRATTHWMCRYELAARYPQVTGVHSRACVKDGPFVTCSTTSAAMQLARTMIASDYGDEIAKRAFHYFQPSHSDNAAPHTGHGEDEPEDRFLGLMNWAERNLDQPLTVNLLAERVGMSPGHFVAAFSASLGSTPAKAIERLRVEAAVMLFKSGETSPSRVARKVGFLQTRRMRHAFVRVLGKSPKDTREAMQITLLKGASELAARPKA